MTYKHKIPIHLEVADHIVFGLSARQLLVMGAGLATGYLIWTDLGFLNTTQWGLLINGLCSLIPALLGIICAFIRPAARGLEEWALVWFVYLCLPRRYQWSLLPEEAVSIGDDQEQVLSETNVPEEEEENE